MREQTNLRRLVTIRLAVLDKSRRSVEEESGISGKVMCDWLDRGVTGLRVSDVDRLAAALQLPSREPLMVDDGTTPPSILEPPAPA